ncbi:YitT family protein [Salinimicrobium sediminilitoris]|uniref:YitT family protein n=1 Tax=Salinimicrobium sediminilitoris TaxID=2876715 RepID=UPI001E39A209|nr:YitT family protein [Salinimicrobium sediminilitoris]MCC8361198.1 YitT family protein [Salinimicrobium sediminilitoris]
MVSKNPINWRSLFSLHSVVYSLLGIFSAMIALEGFMLPNHFLDGGVTGISIVVEEMLGIPFTYLLVAFNLPFLYLGYRKIGKTFALRALLSILLLTVLMHFIEIPAVTEDKVLIAVFGGFLIGLGLGLVIKGGGVLDGVEIMAVYTTRNSAFSTSEIILVFNGLIFLGAAFVFDLEAAMYSFLVYFTASKTTSYIIDGFEEFTALTIISKDCEDVKSLIVNGYGKAITVYKGERGYLPGAYEVKHDCDIIMTIVTRLEIHRIKEATLKIDPNAFFFVQRIKEVKGGIGKQTAKDPFEDHVRKNLQKSDVQPGE